MDERKALADRLLAEHVYRVDYIRGSGTLISLVPIGYGVLTWIFGADLWGSNVYRTALLVPGAPQSWGTVFVILGVTLLIVGHSRHYSATMMVSLVLAFVLSMFMVTFGVEYATSSNEAALPPALIYGVFSLLFLNLWRLASKMRKLDQIYKVE